MIAVRATSVVSNMGLPDHHHPWELLQHRRRVTPVKMLDCPQGLGTIDRVVILDTNTSTNNTMKDDDHPVAADTDKVVALTMEGDPRNTNHRTVHLEVLVVEGNIRNIDQVPEMDPRTRTLIRNIRRHITRTVPQGAVLGAHTARDLPGHPSEEGHHPEDRRAEEAHDMFLMDRVRVRARVIDQAEAAEETTGAGVGEAKAEEEEAEEDHSDLAMDDMAWSPLLSQSPTPPQLHQLLSSRISVL